MGTMRKIVSLLAVLITGLLWADAALYDGVAAFVNNKVITMEAVMKKLHQMYNFTGMSPLEAREAIKIAYPEFVNMEIDRVLILKAYEDSGAQLPNDVINRRIQDIIADRFGGDEAKLKEKLREQRMTFEEWQKTTRDNLLIRAMQQLQIEKKITVSPKRIKTYFAEHMEDFAEESGVRVRTILITPDQGRAVAEKALADIKAGVLFEEVAKAVSADSQAANGGDWGYVKPEDNFMPVMVNALKMLKKGETSEILEASGYYAIVQKVDVRRGKMPTLEEVWNQVEERVREELWEERYQAWMKELRQKAYIKINEVQL